MPRFIIPSNLKLQNKADMALIITLGKIIDAGSKGLYHSRQNDADCYQYRELGLGTLRLFRLIEQRKRTIKPIKGFKGHLASIPRLVSQFMATNPMDAYAFGYAHTALQNALGMTIHRRPVPEWYYVATAKGRKLYKEIQIVLSGDPMAE